MNTNQMRRHLNRGYDLVPTAVFLPIPGRGLERTRMSKEAFDFGTASLILSSSELSWEPLLLRVLLLPSLCPDAIAPCWLPFFRITTTTAAWRLKPTTHTPSSSPSCSGLTPLHPFNPPPSLEILQSNLSHPVDLFGHWLSTCIILAASHDLISYSSHPSYRP